MKAFFPVRFLILTFIDRLGYIGLGWVAGDSTPIGDELGWGVGLSGKILEVALAGVFVSVGV